MPVDQILNSLHDELHTADAEVKELNTMIAKLEMMGTTPASLISLRADRKAKEQNVARIQRMITASVPVPDEVFQTPQAFVQRAVATTRSELSEVQQRVKELRAAGKLKGKKSRLPLDDCYDLIRINPRTRDVVAAQFWAQIDKSEKYGECWLAKEEFKRNNTKKSLVKAVYIPALGTKMPAVRLCAVLLGLGLDEDSGMRNTCGNEQCVKPAHYRQGRERDKRRKKETWHTPPIALAPAPLEDAEDYQGYIYEQLMDQKEDGGVNQGILFRDMEKKLVPDSIPTKDAMIKAVRLEKSQRNRFYMELLSAKLYLTGFPRRNRSLPISPRMSGAEMFCDRSRPEEDDAYGAGWKGD